MTPAEDPAVRPASTSSAVSRRGLLAGASALGAGAAASGLFGSARPAAATPEINPNRGRPDLVETTSGWVRGRRVDGLSVFLGIPYGGPTGGANRFRPPTHPQSWRGVRAATEFGHVAPQPIPSGRLDYTLLIDWLNQPGGQDEDCLVLNVWTPQTGGQARRPVLVSLHGGGFSTGSGTMPGSTATRLPGSATSSW